MGFRTVPAAVAPPMREAKAPQPNPKSNTHTHIEFLRLWLVRAGSPFTNPNSFTMNVCLDEGGVAHRAGRSRVPDARGRRVVRGAELDAGAELHTYI